MLELKNPKIAVPVVLFAGILWSFGPLVVRYMDGPNQVPWQYIFGRGLTIFIILNLYLYFEEGVKFWKNYLKIGKSGIIGGAGLGIAMISFIYSITNTTAAITLLCLAAMPFFTAILAYLFLKEKISINVWVSIFIATVGIIIMAFGNTEKPIDEVIPKINPTIELFSVLPKAIIIIPIVARNIEIQTFKEILSFKNKKARRAVKKGIAAKHNKVIAAVVFVIE